MKKSMKALAVLGVLAMFTTVACKDKNDVTDQFIKKKKKIDKEQLMNSVKNYFKSIN